MCPGFLFFSFLLVVENFKWRKQVTMTTMIEKIITVTFYEYTNTPPPHPPTCIVELVVCF